MHFLDHLMYVLRANPQKDAVIWRGRAFRYAWLCEAISRWDSLLEESGVKPGSVVSVESDFSPDAIGLLLALVRRSCIVVPLTASVEVKKSEFREIAQVETIISLADGETAQVRSTGARVDHELLLGLRREQHAALQPFERGLRDHGAATPARRGLRGHRKAQSATPADLAHLHQPPAGERGAPASRPLQSGIGDLRDRGHAGEHPEGLPRAVSEDPAVADIRPVRGRHPALELEVQRFAVGQDRR